MLEYTEKFHRSGETTKGTLLKLTAICGWKWKHIQNLGHKEYIVYLLLIFLCKMYINLDPSLNKRIFDAVVDRI